MAKNARLEVSELFYSIQGESSFSGYPCVFIRLAGCNLRCSYCDAQYTYKEASKSVLIGDILRYALDYPGTIVEITGGEPLLQKNCIALLTQLIEQGRTTLLETNGTIDFSDVPLETTIITDVKCPGSGAENPFLDANLNTIVHRNKLRYGSCEVKFVLDSLDDYTWAKEMIRRYHLDTSAPILFSAVTRSFSTQQLAELLLKDQLNIRLQVQLHTLLWPESTRGV